MTGHPIPFKVQLTPEWAITLQQQFRQSQQDKSLVLLNDKLRIWIRCYGAEASGDVHQRLMRDHGAAPVDAFDFEQSFEGPFGRLTYLVPEKPGRTPLSPPTYFTFAHSPSSQLMMAFMYADDTALSAAKDIFESLEFTESGAA